VVTFDQVLPALVREVESLPGFDALIRCAVARDLRGRVRLIIEESRDAAAFDRRAAEARLAVVLGRYFVPPVWSKRGEGDEARLAGVLLDKARRTQVDYVDPVSGSARSSDPKWHKYETRLSKTAWLDRGDSDRPWPLHDGPCIVTFFSFKGGMGRTTALAACAWQLAREGKSVAVLDLDLEAPGAGALLGATTERGLLDLLVDTLATGVTDLETSHAPAEALGAEAANVHVFPAGTLSENFIEKLARLDYSQGTSETDSRRSPVEQALHSILGAIRSRLRVDYIFLDARSGLHDLSALSLTRLAHIDVLLVRASDQSHQGFELTFKTLVRRKGPAHLETIVLHTMASRDPRGMSEERQEVRERTFRVFKDMVYRPPNHSYTIDDASAPHYPRVVSFNNDLVRFGALGDVREILAGEEYRSLCESIKAKAGRTPSPGESDS
jgi:MinD-like ATPase involved in chromosome partitioning or flagellar assembly